MSNLRDAIPGISLSTDVIVGFPEETDDQFEETVSLVQSVRYHSMFSFKYSERPNTLAAGRYPDTVQEHEKSRRLTRLQEVQKEIQTKIHASRVGQTFEVLVDSKSRRRDHELSGRTSGNTVVNFPGEPEWIGQLVNVTIERAGPNSLWGHVEGANAG